MVDYGFSGTEDTYATPIYGKNNFELFSISVDLKLKLARANST